MNARGQKSAAGDQTSEDGIQSKEVRRQRSSDRWVFDIFGLLIGFQITAASAQQPPPNAEDFARLASLLNTNSALRQTNSYVIVPNDVIWLKVYQEDDLETRAKVNKDGLVTIPLLGAMMLSGKSVDQ